MAALLFVAALAAQAATSGTTTSPASPTEASTKPKPGQSTYLDLEAGVGYSTNPFMSLDNSSGRGFGRVSIHGVHTRATERTTTVLSAYAQNTTYTSTYGSEQSFDLNAHHDAAVSERLRLFADADLAYDQGGQLDTRIIGVPVVSLFPGQPPVLILPSSDFLTVRGREYRAAGHLGGQLALGPKDDVNFASGIEHVRFKTGGIETRYTTIPVSFGYDRQISERATVGARVSAERTDYNGPTHYEVISPQLTGHLQLSERMTLFGAVGAAFVSIDNGIRTDHSTGLDASAGLCSIDEAGSLCAHAAIDQGTATSAGPSKSVSVGVDYSRRLDAIQTIQFSLAADHYSNPTSFITGRTFSNANYVRAVADYTRKLGDRWFGGVNLAARKVTQGGPDPDPDISASAFVRYRFGDIQ